MGRSRIGITSGSPLTSDYSRDTGYAELSGSFAGPAALTLRTITIWVQFGTFRSPVPAPVWSPPIDAAASGVARGTSVASRIDSLL